MQSPRVQYQSNTTSMEWGTPEVNTKTSTWIPLWQIGFYSLKFGINHVHWTTKSMVIPNPERFIHPGVLLQGRETSFIKMKIIVPPLEIFSSKSPQDLTHSLRPSSLRTKKTCTSDPCQSTNMILGNTVLAMSTRTTKCNILPTCSNFISEKLSQHRLYYQHGRT